MRVEVGDSSALYAHNAELVAVYEEVYADRLGDPFFAAPRYAQRLAAYAARDGFALVTGRVGGELVGYALGYPLPAGSRWWEGLRTPAGPELVAEDGRRTFAVTEIMVRAAWRRRGHARRLHDALLAGRPQRRATLLVLPDNAPAQAAYASWGWRKVGEIQPFDDAPRYDAMVLALDR
jgi:ribosomal protein S18 acetylase RimI-like enzyme